MPARPLQFAGQCLATVVLLTLLGWTFSALPAARSATAGGDEGASPGGPTARGERGNLREQILDTARQCPAHAELMDDVVQLRCCRSALLAAVLDGDEAKMQRAVRDYRAQARGSQAKAATLMKQVGVDVGYALICNLPSEDRRAVMPPLAR